MNYTAAVLVCHRQAAATGVVLSPEWTYWRDIAEACTAEAELTPCSPHCVGVHTVVTVDRPRRHAAGTAPTRSSPGSRADRLHAAAPRQCP